MSEQGATMSEQGDFTNDHGAHAAADKPRAALEDDRVALELSGISIMETGRRLRSVLKDRYPNVRFRVRVARGMERSIDIEWTGGPLADEVVMIARDYIGVGARHGGLRGDGGAAVDRPGRGMGAEGGRYDVSRIEVCRLKADGSVDKSRVLHANGTE